MTEPDGQIKVLEASCDAMLTVPKVRFTGVIDRMGNMVVGKFKKGVKPYLDDQENRMAYMEFAMELFLREEFDEKLGEIEYVLSRRKKISLISIPLGDYMVLVSAEPGADAESAARAARDTFADVI